jgi:hypothetical protein
VPNRFQRGTRLGNRLVACVGLAWAGIASAEQRYFEPRVSLYGFYEDNVGLQNENETDSPGYILRASATGGRREEHSDINLRSEAVRRHYCDDSDLNTTDLFLDGEYVRRIETDRFWLKTELDLDSTLTSEVATTGRVQVRDRRVRWEIAPGWERQVSERLSVNANGSFQDVDYDDNDSTGLIDYDFSTFGGGLSYGLNERIQLLGRASFDRYDANTIDNTSETISALGGLSFVITETWSVSALLGGRLTDIETRTGTDDSTGGVADISATRQLETGSTRFGLTRSIVPSGDGEVLDTTSVDFNWTKNIVPRWRGILDARAFRNEQPSGDASSSDRDYFDLRPRLRFQLEREWSLEFGYRYRYQRYEERSGSATANAVYFTVAYAPQREGADLDLTRYPLN